MTTIAGDCALGAWGWVDGLGKAARFSGPSSLALLPAAAGAASEGVLYVSDMANNAVRVLTLAAGAGAAAVSTLVPSLGGDVAHTKAPYKMDFHRETRMPLNRPWAARTVDPSGEPAEDIVLLGHLHHLGFGRIIASEIEGPNIC